MYCLDEFHAAKFNLFAYIKTGLHLPNSADILKLLAKHTEFRKSNLNYLRCHSAREICQDGARFSLVPHHHSFPLGICFRQLRI